MNVVDSAVPFQRITELFTNPAPVAARVNAGPPAVAEFGEMPDRVRDGELTEKVSALLLTPMEFWIVTLALPAEAIRLAGTVAVNWPEFTKMVVNGDPFHRTTAVFRKPLPFAVRVKVEPAAVADAGDRPVRVKVVAAAQLPFSFR